MKIAYIVPGTGEAFYCGNCLRDSSFIKAFQKAGHEIITVPMYLPLTLKEDVNRAVSPIFYGAVNLYLKQQSPVFKKLPKSFNPISCNKIGLQYTKSPVTIPIIMSFCQYFNFLQYCFIPIILSSSQTRQTKILCQRGRELIPDEIGSS